MFKKKPQIKNLSPLRSSERRKLADQIRRDYDIPEAAQPVPPTTENTTIDTQTSPQSTQQPSLANLRNSLLPESTSAAKFTTTSGPNSTPVSGTVYVGAHPGLDERILWFQVGKDDRLIPTVYTLWHNPGLVSLLHTGDVVVQKLRGGADLFAPGLIRPRKGFDERAKKGAVVAVAGLNKDTVPAWVGVCDVDVAGLREGTGGVAVRGLHWEGDELWNWSMGGKGGMIAPESVDGWQGLHLGIESQMDDLDVDSEDEEDEDDQNIGGVALDRSMSDLKDSGEKDNTREVGEATEAEPEREPTTKEIDDAFFEAFLYSCQTAKKSGEPPHYNLPFPIQASYLIANMILPHLRFPNQHYTIKKTSWKNAKKFIKYLDKTVLVKSKDRNGGETVILDIDFDDQQIKNFQPYRLPKPKATAENENTLPTTDLAGSDSSLNQKLTIQILYRASSRLVPQLLPSKTDFYTPQQITNAVKKYIEANPNLVIENNKRKIRLDPFLANNILSSNSSSDDTKILATGEVDRGSLNRRIIEDDHLCVPYHLLLRNQQVYDTENHDPSLKPRAGPAPSVVLTIEKRTGTKVVTKMSGLEHFFINPQIIVPELQKKCAGSASVGQLMGGKPGLMEVVVQGDQRSIIERDILGRRGVKPEWVEVVDKTKKKGKN